MNGEEILTLTLMFSIDFFFYKNGKIKKQQAFAFQQKGDHHD